MVDGATQSCGLSLLSGRSAVVAMGGVALGAELARGLRRHGARVAETSSGFHTRERANDAMAMAAGDAGGADLILHACAMPSALSPRALDSISRADWHSAVHRSMLATLFCLQAAYCRQRETGGSVVLIGPSTSLVGAAGLVPLMTLAEAQRTLIKSAARQWGRHGIRLNWVGISPAHYAAALSDAAVPLSPELGSPPPALGRVPEPEAEVADVVAWLAGDAARGVTGATFNLDGGDWMVP